MKISRVVLLLSVAGSMCAQKVNLDTQTTGTNFYWDNTNKRVALGWNGSFSGVLGKKFDIKDAGPTWTALATQYNAMRVAVNGYPANAQFGSNLVGIPEAITGALDIPFNATFANHGAGVAGYARGASAANGPVGVFGAGLCAATLVPGCWGANFMAANTATIHNPVSHALPLVGFNQTNLYGIEIDVGIHPPAGIPIPFVNARGIYLVLGSGAETSSDTVNALEVDHVGSFNWRNAFYSRDAAATTGLFLGTAAAGDNTGSQPIVFSSRTSGGTHGTGMIYTDPDGNMVHKSGTATGIHQLQNGSGTPVFSVTPTNTVLSSMLRLGPAATPASSSTGCTTGDLTWDANFLFLCINTNTWKRVALAAF